MRSRLRRGSILGLLMATLAGAASAQDLDWERHRSAGARALARGRVDEAERQVRAALRYARAFRPADRRVADTLEDLASVLVAKERLAEAERALLEALMLREHLDGVRSRPVARTLGRLADLDAARGRWLRAERLAQAALSIDEEILPPDSALLVASLDRLGGVLAQLPEKLEESARVLRRAVSVRYTAGYSEREIAGAMLRHADVLARLGQRREAEHLRARAREMLPADHSVGRALGRGAPPPESPGLSRSRRHPAMRGGPRSPRLEFRSAVNKMSGDRR